VPTHRRRYGDTSYHRQCNNSNERHDNCSLV
jgi:hypothetical protein